MQIIQIPLKCYTVRVVAFFFITLTITPLYVVAAMDETSVERIGDVYAGLVENAGGLEKINEPNLLVLSSKQGAPHVLYCSRARRVPAGGLPLSFEYRIDFLPLPNSTEKHGIRALFDDYPITYKGKVTGKLDVRTAQAIDLKTIRVGDVTGDGADELVFLANPGKLNVYDKKKSISSFRPSHFKPEIYHYEVRGIHHFFNQGKDSYLYLLSRRPHETADLLGFDEKPFYTAGERALIILVNDDGCHRIIPKPNRHRGPSVAPVHVFAVGAVHPPTSKTTSGLVICAQLFGKKGVYSIPHDMDGSGAGAPVKIMETENPDDKFHYFFSPRSSQIWLYNQSNDTVFTFKQGSKDVRVISIDTGGTTPMGTLRLPGPKAEAALLLLDDSKESIYAVGSRGQYFMLKDAAVTEHRQRTPYLNFKPTSSAHTIHDIARVGKDRDRFLVVESHPTHHRKVSDGELIAAGKKYLSDTDYQYCHAQGLLEFDELMRWQAKQESEQRGLTQPIDSLDDIKKHLPDLYQRLSAEARALYIDSLRIWLLAPTSREKLNHSSFKQKEEYYAWWQHQFSQAQTVLTLVDRRGKILSRKVAQNYYQPESLFTHSDIPLPAAQYAEVGGEPLFFVALKSGSAGEDVRAAYYLIK